MMPLERSTTQGKGRVNLCVYFDKLYHRKDWIGFPCFKVVLFNGYEINGYENRALVCARNAKLKLEKARIHSQR
jgi:hypothetical protein